ncbi:MAG: beta-hydroxyacyl-ACP dehydratase [Bacteroidales bacterium]|nr:beta-hydroxyacyl-ACP dehydratase [Bacteroidales bacterium]
MKKYSREELKAFMPHREPMLLVDEAWLDDEGIAHATYKIREDEFFCRGHFPGTPIVPGVIQCEIMAQSCVVTVKDEIPGNNTLYTGINNVKFKNMVRPGDLCEMTCKLTDRKGPLFFCQAKLEVGGKLCCKGDLSFALIPIEK